MTTFDSNWNVIETPDYELGYVEQRELPVVHEYVIDEPEISHEEVVAEYPETGGKDVQIVIDREEKGHWETKDEEGNIVNHFDGMITEGFPKDELIPDIWYYDLYIPYTPEELAEMEEQRKQAEAEQEKYDQQQEWLEKAPERVDAIESGVNDAYEATAELGVEVADHAVTLDDIMNAVAELGVELEAING